MSRAYTSSELNLENIIEFGAQHVVIATGAKWRKDGVGREHYAPIEGSDQDWVFSPDDVMAGLKFAGQVVIYDDDHFYMGGVVAELARMTGVNVTLVTPAPDVSHWTHYTLEQGAIQQRLGQLGVIVKTQWEMNSIGERCVDFSCAYSERELSVPCDQLIMVTSRQSNDELYQSCISNIQRLRDAGVTSVDRIGDCVAPGTIAAAVYSGHLWARQLGDDRAGAELPFSRELIGIHP